MNNDNQPVPVSEHLGQPGVSLHSEGPATHTAKIIGGMNTQILGRAKRNAIALALPYGDPSILIPSAKAPKKETLINRRAVKAYALGLSKSIKAGKFERVGESFYIGVEARLDSKIRQLPIHEANDRQATGLKLTTKHARDKAVERLELATAQIVYGMVCRHPSVGVTLKD